LCSFSSSSSVLFLVVVVALVLVPSSDVRPDTPAGHAGKQPRSPIEDDDDDEDEDEKEGKDEHEHDDEKGRIMPQRGFRTQPRGSTLRTPPKGMRPEGARDRAY
jgi:hypothetical protein